MDKLIYAGIGSRQTPEHIMTLMTEFAEWANENSWICSTGGAKGADTAFINGAGTQLHNWLPFANYNGYKSNMPSVKQKALEMAKKFHPNPDAIRGNTWLMHARNCNIVLGEHLIEPVKFIVCWTPNGEMSGGTGQALRLAKHYNIFVLNLGDPEFDPKESIEWLKKSILYSNEIAEKDIFGDWRFYGF